jgi:hypothetical protein
MITDLNDHIKIAQERFGNRPIILTAKKHGCNYITPEDISDCIKDGVPIEELRRDFLMIMSYGCGWGIEDEKTCAFILIENEKY